MTVQISKLFVALVVVALVGAGVWYFVCAGACPVQAADTGNPEATQAVKACCNKDT